MAICVAGPSSTQTSSPPAVTTLPSSEMFSFRKLCPGREERRGRPGLCPDYFASGMDGRLEAAYYLHVRVVDVIEKLESSFRESIFGYSVRVILLGIGSVAVLIAAALRTAMRTSVLALGAGTVAIATLTFNALGFSAGYKTNLQLWAELIGIRDEIEVRVVMHRSNPGTAFPIDALIERYTKARTLQAAAYANSIGFPELASALKP